MFYAQSTAKGHFKAKETFKNVFNVCSAFRQSIILWYINWLSWTDYYQGKTNGIPTTSKKKKNLIHYLIHIPLLRNEVEWAGKTVAEHGFHLHSCNISVTVTITILSEDSTMRRVKALDQVLHNNDMCSYQYICHHYK